VPAETSRRLHRQGLIDGRNPNLRVAAVASADTRAEHLRARAQDDEHYMHLITAYLEEFGEASRTDIDALLLDKLSHTLTDEQKRRKVGNLLTKMRQAGHITNDGTRGLPRWRLLS
jgi:ATP-dependent DNA helicase RecG